MSETEPLAERLIAHSTLTDPVARRAGVPPSLDAGESAFFALPDGTTRC